jgi:hypothetical protein
MSWGTRKRNFILLIFFVIVFLVLAIAAFLVFYEEPTCFDKKQNGNETGIDCGGNCDLLCNTATVDPIIHWVRYFKIAEGLYSVIAYVENQNTNAAVKNVPYSFKLYDNLGVKLAEKNGLVNLNPRQIKIIEYLYEKEKVSRKEYSSMMKISFMTSFRDLQELVDKKYIIQKGKSRGTYYTLKEYDVKKESIDGDIVIF